MFGNIRLKYGIRNLKNFIDWKIFGYFSFRNSSSNSRLIVLRYCLVEVNNHERKSDFKIHRFSRVFRSCLSFPRRSILMLFNFPYVITIFPRESFFQEKILKKLFQSTIECFLHSSLLFAFVKHDINLSFRINYTFLQRSRFPAKIFHC